MNTHKDCPFCILQGQREIIYEKENCYAMFDKYPVSDGHSLIIPKRHCCSYFDLPIDEQSSCILLLNKVKSVLDERYNPDGYNVGINIGSTAGQTIGHVHIHLIPRYDGDVSEPEGGVRGVIPEKRRY